LEPIINNRRRTGCNGNRTVEIAAHGRHYRRENPCPSKIGGKGEKREERKGDYI